MVGRDIERNEESWVAHLRLLVRHLDEGRAKLVADYPGHPGLVHPHPASVFVNGALSSAARLVAVVRRSLKLFGALRDLRTGEVWEELQKEYMKACAGVRETQTAMGLSHRAMFRDLGGLPPPIFISDPNHLTPEQYGFLLTARVTFDRLTEGFLKKAEKWFTAGRRTGSSSVSSTQTLGTD